MRGAPVGWDEQNNRMASEPWQMFAGGVLVIGLYIIAVVAIVAVIGFLIYILFVLVPCSAEDLYGYVVEMCK